MVGHRERDKVKVKQVPKEPVKEVKEKKIIKKKSFFKKKKVSEK